ncbi:hypothetical protein PoB_003736800 [Plakobranchus ocellatus]|uniref:Uncharacterized protein n=1 Tax=Plakobranchus ocellatus TaxID=259542 RepID=A0AAV4AVJ8_9GAST|nr:hypothetical protein PoB_003736800 [Plakobranchus ocellatus]
MVSDLKAKITLHALTFTKHHSNSGALDPQRERAATQAKVNLTHTYPCNNGTLIQRQRERERECGSFDTIIPTHVYVREVTGKNNPAHIKLCRNSGALLPMGSTSIRIHRRQSNSTTTNFLH